VEGTLTLTWTAHPARRRPRELALVVAVVSVTMAAVLVSFESAFLAAVAGAILVVAVAPFLLPTRYTITDEEVTARRGLLRRARRFAELRRLEVGRDAALVSPFGTPNPLDRRRGLVILLDGADRERVLAVLRQKLSS
jgi:hypothetical protein